MTSARVTSAVVIPARNEEDRIGPCLAALLTQDPATVRVVVVMNNTTDATEDVIRAQAQTFGTEVDVLDIVLPPDQGVGTARRLGCAHAIETFPNLAVLLNTDADGIAAPDWIARNLVHLRSVEAVCGAVRPIPSEAPPLSGRCLEFAEWEGQYRALVLDWYRRFAPEAANPHSHHGEASGASLAIRVGAYLDAGGFEGVRTGEDRNIVRRLKSLGHGVRHAGDVVMQVSCRLAGRAPGGMAAALVERISQRSAPYLIDDALPSSGWLRANILTPGIWPPRLPPERRLAVDQLPYHIRSLQALLEETAPETLLRAPTPIAS